MAEVTITDRAAAAELLGRTRERTIAARNARVLQERVLFNRDGSESMRFRLAGLIDFEHGLSRMSQHHRQTGRSRRPRMGFRTRTRMLISLTPLLVYWVYLRLNKRARREFEDEMKDFAREVGQPLESIMDAGGLYNRTEGGRAWIYSRLPAKTPVYLFPLRLSHVDAEGVEVLSRETVRGTVCDHYRIVSSTPFELWIDPEGRIRRISRRSDASRDSWWPGSWHSETTELWDFGAAPEIHPPAPEDVIDRTSVQNDTYGPPPPSPFDTETPFG